MKSPHWIQALLCAALSAMLSAQTVSIAVPYIPGRSFGPMPVPIDTQLDQDEKTYAAAYWELLESGGMNSSLMQSFVPTSPLWNDFGSNSQSMDHDPFAEGRYIFRNLYAHRLQLDPLAGPFVDIDELVAIDPWVYAQWRFWTLTHQVVTSAAVDSIAHTNHVNAIIEALTVGFEWTTGGIPFFDDSVTMLVSENTKKLKGNPGVAPPNPVNVGGLPAAVQACDARIRAAAGRLTGFNGLYDADGGWWLGHKGFDCDDFADAIGSYTIKGQAGMTACTVRVTWTGGNKKGAAHRITKFSCGGYYWLVDAQTGAVSGPHQNGTPVDGRPVIGGYDVDQTKPVITTDDCRALGSRPGLSEPPAWYDCQAQLDRFQQITNLDPACFH